MLNTGGMSPEERRVTGELLMPIKEHCALVIVEHDLDFIKDICDHLTVLDQGRVVARGTHAALLANSPRYAAVYRRQLRDDLPQAEARR